MEEEDYKKIIQIRNEFDKTNREKEKKLKLKKNMSEKIKLNPSEIIPTKIYKNIQINPSLKNKWVYKKIITSLNKKENEKNPQIKSWVEKKKSEKIAFFTKFNIKLKMPEFTDEDYSNFLEDEKWTKKETKNLFDLLEIFEGNFIIVNDRGNFGDKKIEDLKERVFKICKLLDEKRNVVNSKYKDIYYDKEIEKIRKIKSEKYLTRPKEMFEIENKLLSEMKNLEILIKKKERENRNFKKLIEFTKTEKLELEDNKINLEKIETQNIDLISEKPYAFNRGSFMKGPILTLPPLTNKKIELALIQLEKPTNIIATKENMEKFDLLRKLLLKLFSLKYYFDKKKEELENLKLKVKPEFSEQKGVIGGDDLKKLKSE